MIIISIENQKKKHNRRLQIIKTKLQNTPKWRYLLLTELNSLKYKSTKAQLLYNTKIKIQKSTKYSQNSFAQEFIKLKSYEIWHLFQNLNPTFGICSEQPNLSIPTAEIQNKELPVYLHIIVRTRNTLSVKGADPHLILLQKVPQTRKLLGSYTSYIYLHQFIYSQNFIIFLSCFHSYALQTWTLRLSTTQSTQEFQTSQPFLRLFLSYKSWFSDCYVIDFYQLYYFDDRFGCFKKKNRFINQNQEKLKTLFTIGLNFEAIQNKKFDIISWDIRGEKKSFKGIIYTFDCFEKERRAREIFELHQMLLDPLPLLKYSNKQDLEKQTQKNWLLNYRQKKFSTNWHFNYFVLILEKDFEKTQNGLKDQIIQKNLK
ncbi:unnamed protein product [Paramecium pentaurelia]|uniref:Uncharacterized protein n=1 Tax=Paramecium pentaurelia TaxID=43138 RepID=A0A8S1X7U9_9CILI|nr:unnamed protein product [Paramecium pentaurelia]